MNGLADHVTDLLWEGNVQSIFVWVTLAIVVAALIVRLVTGSLSQFWRWIQQASWTPKRIAALDTTNWRKPLIGLIGGIVGVASIIGFIFDKQLSFSELRHNKHKVNFDMRLQAYRETLAAERSAADLDFRREVSIGDPPSLNETAVNDRLFSAMLTTLTLTTDQNLASEKGVKPTSIPEDYLPLMKSDRKKQARDLVIEYENLVELKHASVEMESTVQAQRRVATQNFVPFLGLLVLAAASQLSIHPTFDWFADRFMSLLGWITNACWRLARFIRVILANLTAAASQRLAKSSANSAESIDRPEKRTETDHETNTDLEGEGEIEPNTNTEIVNEERRRPPTDEE